MVYDIKTLRIALGLSQAELATVLGVTKTTVARYELGLAKPIGPILRKLGLLNMGGIHVLKMAPKDVRLVLLAGFLSAGVAGGAKSVDEVVFGEIGTKLYGFLEEIHS